MSRIGKKPIHIPGGVTVAKNENKLTVKGPKGELSWVLHPAVDVDIANDVLTVKPVANSKKASALWGTTRARIQNMIEGAARGFEKKLEIEGIGYRATLDGSRLQLTLGFSHPVWIEAPEGIKFSVEKNVITVSGHDKDMVGEVAARIRRTRPPEPYKGKGIHYMGEVIRRKAGKKAVAAS